MVTNDPYGIYGAVRPWDSLDAARRPCRRVPTAKQAEIDRCLNCTRAREDCDGTCRNGIPIARAPRVNVADIRRLAANGYNAYEIANMLSCSHRTVRNKAYSAGIKIPPWRWSIKRRMRI